MYHVKFMYVQYTVFRDVICIPIVVIHVPIVLRTTGEGRLFKVTTCSVIYCILKHVHKIYLPYLTIFKSDLLGRCNRHVYTQYTGYSAV